jgi:hypothetical protein
MSKATISTLTTGLSVLIFTLSFAFSSGCSYRDKRDEKNARKAAEISQKIQNEQEAERVAIAKSDLSARIAYYQGIEGEYTGWHMSSSYSSKNLLSYLPAGKMAVKIRISAINIPADYIQARITREAEVLSQMESMRLQIDIFEGDTSLNLIHVACSATEVKPDFVLGIIRFSCPATTSYPAKTYNLTLDYIDEEFDTYGDASIPDSIYDEHPLLAAQEGAPAEYARSSSVAHALIKQSLRNVPLMNLEVISPDVTVRGKVWRRTSVR